MRKTKFWKGFVTGIIVGAIAMYVGLWLHAGYKLTTIWPKVCPSCYEEPIDGN